MVQPDAVHVLNVLRAEMGLEFSALHREIYTLWKLVKKSAKSKSEFITPDAETPAGLPRLADAEANLIRAALATAGNAKRAAELLGIGKTTMYRKCKELGLGGDGAAR